jgi:hypothetical protein
MRRSPRRATNRGQCQPMCFPPPPAPPYANPQNRISGASPPSGVMVILDGLKKSPPSQASSAGRGETPSSSTPADLRRDRQRQRDWRRAENPSPTVIGRFSPRTAGRRAGRSPTPARVKKPRRRVVEVRRRVAKRGKADRAQLPGWRPRIRNCQVDGNGVDASRSTDSAKAFHAAKAVLGSAR